MGIVKEFKEFAVKGNMIDIAVGIIIGAAFGKVVSSLVADVILPPLGLIIGGVNFTELKIPLGTGRDGAPVSLNYGAFLQAMLDFFIVACAVFMLVKAVNQLKRKEEVAPSAPPPTREQILLTEIRDLLKAR